MVAFMRYDNRFPIGSLSRDTNDPMVKFAKVTDGTANTAFYAEFVISDTTKTDITQKRFHKYQVYIG